MNNSIIQPAAHLTGARVSPPPAAGTADEELLLGQYGKVFYYKVEYSYTGDPYNYHPDVYYALSLEVANINDPEWTAIQDPLTASTYQDIPFESDLHFYDNGGNGSKEIVVDPTSFYDEADGQVRSNSWFSTSSGPRKIFTRPAGYPLYYPPGISTLEPVPGAEPRGIAIYFD